MKSLCRRIVAAAMLAAGVCSVPASGQVVISQVFGVPTGGNGGATYSYEVDYIELFNRGNAPVDMTGWSVQAEWLGDWEVIPLAATLQPGQYYLIQVYERQPSQTNTGAPLPTPDLIAQAGGFNNPDSTWLSGSQGAVALMSNTTQIVADACPDSDPALLDLVAWGSAILTCGTGVTNAPSQSNFLTITRKNGGCTDTNSSAADFELKTPNPRNTTMVFPFYATVSATPAAPSGTTKLTASITPFVCGATAALTMAAADLSSVGGSASAVLFDNGSNGDATAGDGTFSLDYALPGAVAAGQYTIPMVLTDGSSNMRTVDAQLNVAIAGDACQTAKPIGALPFNDNYTTADFTDDALIVPCRSVASPAVSRFGVWYTITPASNMVLKVSKNSTLFNLSLYTGSCSNLTIIDCDDSNSAANWRLTAGVTYYMLSMFDSANAPTTNATLSFTEITPPSNDLCTGAVDLNLQSLPYLADTSFQQFHDATADEDNTCDNSPVVTRRGLWYSYLPAVDSILRTADTGSAIVSSSLWSGTCPGGLSMVACVGSDSGSYYLAAGQRYYVLIGSNSTAQPGTTALTYSNTFTVTVPPANDLCANAEDLGSLATPLSINPGPVLSSASSDTTPCGAATFGVWYRFTAPTAGLLRLSEGSSVDVSWAVLPSCGSSTTDLCTTTDTDRFLSMAAGQQVVILLYSSSTSTTATNLTFEFIPPLANDVCAGAIDLNAQSFPYTANLDARNSTAHDIDQGPCTTRTDTQYGVWFKYTAPSTSILTMVDSSAAAVNFGMFLAGNSGNPCGTLSPSVACSKDSDAGAFQVQAGETYMILAGNGTGSGQPSAAYSITFDLQNVVVNDNCATATNISNALPYSEVVNAFLAQHEPDVSCNPPTATNLFNGVWYTIIPNSNMNVTVWEANQASLNVTVYTSCGGGEVYCETNDVTYSMTAGQAYYFLVGRNLVSSAPSSGSGSTYDLHFVRSQPMTNDTCATASPITQTPFNTIIDLSTATNDTVPPLPCSSSTTNVVQGAWYKIMTLTAGQLTGTIEVDYARANSGVAAIFRSIDGTCENLDPTPIVCGTDPTSVPLVIDLSSNLDANTTYYLIVGLPSSSSTDFVLSIDNLNYSGTLDQGTQTCCRGTTCNTVAAGACTGTIAGSNSLVVTSCGTGNAFASCCYADYNHDGTQSIDDLFLYFNAYFTTSPMADFGGDGTSQPTIDDLFLYINAYFGTCS